MTTQTLSEPDARLARRVAGAVGKAKFDLWFGSAALRADGRQLRVSVPNRFIADWIDRHFREPMQSVAREELGDGASVRLCVEAGEAAPAAARDVSRGAERPAECKTDAAHAPRSGGSAGAAGRERASAPARPLRGSAALRYELADFIVGPSNELAYTAACRLADDPECRMNPLFVHGRCGLGKTHLLQGLCRRYLARQPGAQWCYTTAEDFTNQFIHAVRNNKLGEFRRRLRRLDLLAVDDVHFLANKSATQNEFLHTFDAIDLHGAKLVLASDAHPKLIEQLGNALVSRFLSGMVVRVNEPDAEMRVRLIGELARRRGLELGEGVAEALADHGDPSVREIEGMLTKLAALASLGRPAGPDGGAPGQVGHALLHRLIGADEQAAQRRPVPLEQIIRVVSLELNVERSQIMARSRHRRVVLARSVAIFLARQLTTLSYPELARALGRPNHSTIVTAAQRVEQQVRQRQPIGLLDMPAAASAPTVDRLVDRLRQRVLSSSREAGV